MCEFCEDKKKLEALKELIGAEPDYCPVCGSTFALKRMIESIREKIGDSYRLYANKSFYYMEPEAIKSFYNMHPDCDITKEAVMLGIDLNCEVDPEPPKE